MDLGGGAGGALALQDVLRELADRAFKKQSLGQEQQRIKIAQQGANDNSVLRRLEQQDRADSRAATQKLQAQTGALKLAGSLRPQQEISDGQAATLDAGDMGDKVVGPTLSSRNIGQGLTSTPNPGRGTTFAGTPDQLDEQAQDEELQRQMTLQPKMSGALRMIGALPRANRGGAITEMLREQAKPPERSPALKEYQDAQAQGFTGSFTDYQNVDANRKRPVVNVQAGQNANNNLAMKLADDYTRDAKDYTIQNGAMRRIVASAKDPSAAGDMALLYGYMKMLDPNSVVRESEFATAAQSGSLPQQIQGAATKILNGQRLTPEQRADFVNRAQRLYGEAQGTNKTIRKSYEQRAKKFGVDPSLVFTDIDEPAAPTGGPKNETPEQRLARLLGGG